MKKDFDNWNTKKKELEEVKEKFLFKTGDIWWCSVGLNVKAESCGKRRTVSKTSSCVKEIVS